MKYWSLTKKHLQDFINLNTDDICNVCGCGLGDPGHVECPVAVAIKLRDMLDPDVSYKVLEPEVISE